MIKKQLLLILAILPFSLFAQNELDVLRYSQNFPVGTARSMGMAGSFGALGADASVLSTNPAGLALFRTSEYTITPNFLYNETKNSQMLGTSVSTPGYNDHRLSFNLANHALVLAFEDETGNKLWSGLNIGFGYNELNNYDANEIIKGTNNSNSLLNYFMYNSDGLWPDQLALSEGLAFDTYLIDTIPNDPNLYYSNFLYGATGIQQKKIYEKRGKIGEYAFSFAANFSDKLYLGATIGIHNLKYNITSKYSEFDTFDLSELEEFVFTENYNIRGVGANLKIGMLARITDNIRFGAALHTPTFYNINDEMDLTMDSYFNESPYPDMTETTFSQSSGLDMITYEITSPLKAQANLAIIINKIGAVNIDYEYVDYTSSTIRSSDVDLTDLDAVINDNLQASSNLKIGAELMLGYIALRGGMAYYGDPYTDLAERVVPGERIYYTAGLGMRYENSFVDFGYVYSHYKDQEYLFPVLIGEAHTGIEKSTVLNRIALTIGFKF